MKSLFTKDNYLRSEMVLINLTILFYLCRIAIPFLKYLFVFSYTCLIIYTFIRYRRNIIPVLGDFIRNNYLVLILFLFLLSSFTLSQRHHVTILKDIVNALIIISVFFMMSLHIKNQIELKKVFSEFQTLIIFFAVVIALYGIFDILHIISGVASTKEIDYNFGIVPVIFGLIAVSFLLIRTDSSVYKLVYIILMVLFSVSIFLAGSRRGLIFMGLFLLIIVIVQTVRIFNNKLLLKKIASRTVLYLIAILFLLFSSYLFVRLDSYSFKNKVLELAGSKNLLSTKSAISLVVHKYYSVFDNTKSYRDIYKIVWTPVFNPLDPESSWGVFNHKNVFPLTGKNVEIVPENAKGYLLDHTCISSPEKDYIDAPSLLANVDVNEGDRINAYVYCYVSEDFDGDVVRLTTATELITKKLVKGTPVAYYNLQEKGTWKRLDINFECRKGVVPIYISFVKKGVKDFSNLKGHVIFAHPDFTLIKNDTVFSSSEEEYNRFDKPETKAFEIVVNEANVLAGMNYILSNPFAKLKDGPFRNWMSKFHEEDTIHYKYENELSVDAIWNKYGDERIIRWIFAFQIFSKEYNWSKKLFGGGFDFLNWYGYYFLGDKTKIDYPHNPFLYILLYSGILGLAIYIIFMYKVFYYYIKYIREYPLLFIFFLITFFFSFFSGGSPFDPPVMGFFSILPFFIHAIHKRELSKKSDSDSQV